MIKKDVIIIGGGPAGLCAAQMFVGTKLSVLIIDRDHHLGGQLMKQTHKFFGSKEQYAKERGFVIAQHLIDKISEEPNIEVIKGTTVTGLYSDRVVTTICESTYKKYQADAIIVATGASERALAFENNDLPGVYGAGAIQTLMNIYGIMPAQEVVMIGSGNIGLIVSYQLIQAGVRVKALIEAQSVIGGYKVHASKLKRLGVPFLMQKTIVRALGETSVNAIEIASLDDQFQVIPNTNQVIETDAVCIAVGLSPMTQLLGMLHVDMKYIKELGGLVPVLNEDHQTSIPFLFTCGDASGIEEASSAMMEGHLAGLGVLKYLGHQDKNHNEKVSFYHQELKRLRDSAYGEKTKQGLNKLHGGPYVN
ncbi:MAG: NAD(P)/FAD-dependent oxidoreductase [Acholeplasmataceae bacterium]